MIGEKTTVGCPGCGLTLDPHGPECPARKPACSDTVDKPAITCDKPTTVEPCLHLATSESPIKHWPEPEDSCPKCGLYFVDDPHQTAGSPEVKTEYKIDDRIRAIVVPGGMVMVIDGWENGNGENYSSAVTSEFLPGATVEQFEAIYGVNS